MGRWAPHAYVHGKKRPRACNVEGPYMAYSRHRHGHRLWVGVILTLVAFLLLINLRISDEHTRSVLNATGSDYGCV